jgi:hypothetical protein
MTTITDEDIQRGDDEVRKHEFTFGGTCKHDGVEVTGASAERWHHVSAVLHAVCAERDKRVRAHTLHEVESALRHSLSYEVGREGMLDALRIVRTLSALSAEEWTS